MPGDVGAMPCGILTDAAEVVDALSVNLPEIVGVVNVGEENVDELIVADEMVLPEIVLPEIVPFVMAGVVRVGVTRVGDVASTALPVPVTGVPDPHGSAVTQAGQPVVEDCSTILVADGVEMPQLDAPRHRTLPGAEPATLSIWLESQLGKALESATWPFCHHTATSPGITEPIC